jgi:amidase
MVPNHFFSYLGNAALVIVLGHYLWESYHSKYYAKSQDLRRSLRVAYDEVLKKYDLLAMPTTPIKAQEILRKAMFSTT